MKCYRLNNDYSNIGDTGKDAFIYEFEGFDMIGSNILGMEKLSLPKPMFFSADFKDDKFTDYPITDIHSPIMSQKMIDVINPNIKNHLVEIYPCTMVDDTFLETPFKEKGVLKAEVKRKSDYYVLQLNIFEDIFCDIKSVYDESLIFPGKIGTIKKLVLKEPKDGFPLIFRISQFRGYLFVSEQTKNNLEKNNIKGCVFEEVETTPTAV